MGSIVFHCSPSVLLLGCKCDFRGADFSVTHPGLMVSEPVHNLVQGLIYCIINLYNNNPILANRTKIMDCKANKYGMRETNQD